MAYKRTRGLVRLFFGTVTDDQIHRVYRFRVALFFVLVVIIVAALFLIYQLTQTLDRLYLAEGERDRWQRPDDVIESLKLKDGNVVADVGCMDRTNLESEPRRLSGEIPKYSEVCIVARSPCGIGARLRAFEYCDRALERGQFFVPYGPLHIRKEVHPQRKKRGLWLCELYSYWHQAQGTGMSSSIRSRMATEKGPTCP